MWKCPFPPASVTLHSPRTSFLYTPKILPKNLSPIPQCLTGSPAFKTFHFLRYTPRPRIAIFFQLTIEGAGKLGCHTNPQSKSGVKFLGIVPFWLNFCNFGTENSRFGTIPRILLVLNDPIRNWHPVGCSTELKHRVQGVRNICVIDHIIYQLYHVIFLNRAMGALQIPIGTYHRSESGEEGSIVLNQATRDDMFDQRKEFSPVSLRSNKLLRKARQALPVYWIWEEGRLKRIKLSLI